MEETEIENTNGLNRSRSLCEEDGHILDDKLLDVVVQSSPVTIIDGSEDVRGVVCSKCRTISSSFLSSSPFSRRRANSSPRSRLSRDETSDGPMFFRQAHNAINDSADDSPLIGDFDDDLPTPNGDVTTNGPEHCHTAKQYPKETRRAVTKLLLACTLTTVFLIAEAIGGWLANSIAIMSDAAHLLSDLTSFIVSLIAIYLSMRPASKKMNFGYQRAEVLGAVISVLIIWLITGGLVYIAIERISSMDFEVESDTMIIVSALGVVFNIILGFVLHTSGGGHGHSHGGVSHSHSPMPNAESSTDTNNNINLRAAFIHVLGDLVQSVGVLVSAYIIHYYPNYKIADPICTFIFSIIVLMTTIPILKDLAIVLMEGTPPGFDYNAICAHLSAIPGVKMVHSLHVWALTLDKNALSVHLAIAENCDTETVLKDAQRVIRYRYHVFHTTIQVENYQPLLMENCQECQPLQS